MGAAALSFLGGVSRGWCFHSLPCFGSIQAGRLALAPSKQAQSESSTASSSAESHLPVMQEADLPDQSLLGVQPDLTVILDTSNTHSQVPECHQSPQDDHDAVVHIPVQVSPQSPAREASMVLATLPGPPRHLASPEWRVGLEEE